MWDEEWIAAAGEIERLLCLAGAGEIEM